MGMSRIATVLIAATASNVFVSLIASQIAPVGEFTGDASRTLSVIAPVNRLRELASLPPDAKGTAEDLVWAQNIEDGAPSLTGKYDHEQVWFSVRELPMESTFCTYSETMYESCQTYLTACSMTLPIARQDFDVGWPFRSFRATRLRHQSPDTWSFDARTILPSSLRPSVPLCTRISSSMMPTGTTRPLPVFPRWFGLVANTGMYALIWCIPFLVTRFWRASRHECPSCGYSRLGLAEGTPCPECGLASTTPIKANSASPM